MCDGGSQTAILSDKLHESNIDYFQYKNSNLKLSLEISAMSLTPTFFICKYKTNLLIPGVAIKILDTTTWNMALLAAILDSPKRLPFSSNTGIPFISSLSKWKKIWLQDWNKLWFKVLSAIWTQETHGAQCSAEHTSHANPNSSLSLP